MGTTDQFNVVTRAITKYSVHSTDTNAWTISVPRLKDVLQELSAYSEFNQPALDDLLEEGVCRGFWTMDYDRQNGVDIVVMR